MSNIKLTIPNDDHVALRAMAKALEEIAVARGAPLRVNLVTQEMLDKLENAPGGHIFCEPEVDNTSQQYEALQKELRKKHIETVTTPFIDTDSTDTPWDERIHSASKALNSDGTWRLRRKPASKDVEEWAAEVEQVLTELTQPIQPRESEKDDIDPEHYAAETAEGVNDIPEPPVTPEGDDFHVDAGEVTEQEVVDIPPLPVPPLPAPPVVSDMTFPQVMAYLTERHGRISNAQVEQIIASMGLKSIMDLNTQPEHIGPFIALVKALLGE